VLAETGSGPPATFLADSRLALSGVSTSLRRLFAKNLGRRMKWRVALDKSEGHPSTRRLQSPRCNLAIHGLSARCEARATSGSRSASMYQTVEAPAFFHARIVIGM
jgi:hypothetical protein